jgi:hypothetical protein
MLNLIDCLYKEEHEEDENVRELWYLFCYHFLPKINKNWKLCLEGTRILKKTFMYENMITTSDEAMTLWMIKNWEPKLKDQSEKGWPDNGKKRKTKQGEKLGEQELRAGLRDYIQYHNLINDFKNKENGAVACRWAEIFWEELVARNPNMFKKSNGRDNVSGNENIGKETNHGEVILLPGIDNQQHNQNVNILSCSNMQKSIKSVTESNSSVNNLSITYVNDNGKTISNDINSNNGNTTTNQQQQHINMDDVTNITKL